MGITSLRACHNGALFERSNSMPLWDALTALTIVPGFRFAQRSGYRRYGRGAGLGRGRGVGVHLPSHGVGVGETVGVAVAVPLAVGVAVAVAVAVADPVAVGVGVTVGDPQGLTGQLKISIEARAARLGSRPPASQMLLVPSVSAAGLRRAFTNGVPFDQVLLTGS